MPSTADNNVRTNRFTHEALGTLDQVRSLISDRENFQPQDSIADKIRTRLESLVSLPRIPTIFPSFRELVFAFEADWKSLEECRNQWMIFLKTVARIVSEIDIGLEEIAIFAARKIEDDWRTELFAGLHWPLSISSKLEASLAPLPLSESQRILSENVSETVKAMADHMSCQIETLVERCVLGEIEWYADSSCQYSFVNRGLHSHSYQSWYAGAMQVDYKKREALRTVERKSTAEKTLMVHIHDLVDAVSSPVQLAITEIPTDARRVIDIVPEFMQEELRIIEGNLIRQRCIQQDLGVAEWTMKEDVTVPYHFDPAIVLAERYVLFGWLDKPKEEGAPPLRSASILTSAIDRLFT